MTQEYSIENGYYVLYSEDLRKREITAFLAIRPGNQQAAISALLTELEEKHNKEFIFRFSENGISIFVKSLVMEDVMKIVSDITLHFETIGYHQSCMISGDTSDLSLYQVGARKVVASNAAVVDFVNTHNESNQQTINPVLGLIGAIIGILLGTIAWIIVGEFGWFVGWIGFLIVFLGIYGFKLLGKGITKGWGIVIMILSLVAIVFAQFFSLGLGIFEYAKSEGVRLTLIEVIIYIPIFLTESSILREFITNLLIGLGIGGLGMFSSISKLPTKDEVNKTIEYTRIC